MCVWGAGGGQPLRAGRGGPRGRAGGRVCVGGQGGVAWRGVGRSVGAASLRGKMQNRILGERAVGCIEWRLGVWGGAGWDAGREQPWQCAGQPAARSSHRAAAQSESGGPLGVQVVRAAPPSGEVKGCLPCMAGCPVRGGLPPRGCRALAAPQCVRPPLKIGRTQLSHQPPARQSPGTLPLMPVTRAPTNRARCHQALVHVCVPHAYRTFACLTFAYRCFLSGHDCRVRHVPRGRRGAAQDALRAPQGAAVRARLREGPRKGRWVVGRRGVDGCVCVRASVCVRVRG